MKNEHDDTDNQQDVDKPRTYVKCQKPQQPQNNQNHRDKSEHASSSSPDENRKFAARLVRKPLVKP